MTDDSQAPGDPGAAQQVQEKAQEAAGQARGKAQEAAGQARSRLREQVDQRSTQAGEQVGSSAQALRATADRLREEGQDGPARAAEQLAGQAEKVGSWLVDSDADRILDDVEEFARRQPLAVVGVGLLVGFAASRLLKASSQSRFAARNDDASRRLPASTGGGAAGFQEPPSVPSGIR